MVEVGTGGIWSTNRGYEHARHCVVDFSLERTELYYFHRGLHVQQSREEPRKNLGDVV